MKLKFLVVLLLLPFIFLKGQPVKISEKLSVIPLTENTYIHTCENNNGLVFFDGSDALIVSTPDSDIETQNLINWIQRDNKGVVAAYVIDRWHPDAMEGLDVLQERNIKTYASELTQRIAKDKGLPVPDKGFQEKTEIKVGKEVVVCHYLGEAHTGDGIVVYVPSEKVLFAGNGI
ncbi:MAG: hypothetical protein MI922_23000, partial [Bacteroidales bacterium]|nr:hypothetical protein [Bacteroidales bacterium]